MSEAPYIQWAILADFDRDNMYEADLTPFVDRPGNGFRVERGHDANGNMRVSQLRVSLTNADGRFSPEYRTGPYYGRLRADIPIAIEATHDEITYRVWTGYAQSWEPSYGGFADANRCLMLARDIASYLQDGPAIDVTLSKTRYVDDAIAAILDALDLGSGDRELDQGVQPLPIHFVRGQTPGAAVVEAVQSEMGGQAWVAGDGKLRFESRASRLGVAGAVAWGDGSDIRPEVPIRYSVRARDVISEANVIPSIFMAGQGEVPVIISPRTYRNEDALRLGPGEIWQGSLDLDAPVEALTEPEPDIDYRANSLQDGTGTDMTGDLDVTATLTGGAGVTLRLENTHGSTAMYVEYQLRGQPTSFAGELPKFTAAKSIPGAKAKRGIDARVPFGDDSQVTRDYAYHLVRTHRMEYPLLVLEFAWTTDAIAAAMLGLEVGTLVRFRDTAPGGNPAWVTNVDDWFYVEGLDLTAMPVNVGRTTVTLVPSSMFRDLDHIAYDLFSRPNGSGLGATLNGLDWTDDGGFSLSSSRAQPSNDNELIPSVDIGGSGDMVVECSLSGLLS